MVPEKGYSSSCLNSIEILSCRTIAVCRKNAAYYLTIVTNIIHAVYKDTYMYIEYNEVYKGVFERGCGSGGGRHTL